MGWNLSNVEHQKECEIRVIEDKMRMLPTLTCAVSVLHSPNACSSQLNVDTIQSHLLLGSWLLCIVDIKRGSQKK